MLSGSGRAFLSDEPVPLSPGVVVGRAARHPHGFLSGKDGLRLLSIQLPRPVEGATTWDQPGETSDPIECGWGGRCRRCPRCGGHSKRMAESFSCENCTLDF